MILRFIKWLHQTNVCIKTYPLGEFHCWNAVSEQTTNSVISLVQCHMMTRLWEIVTHQHTFYSNSIFK